MVKKIVLISALVVMSFPTYGQDVKKEVEAVKTKMDFLLQKLVVLQSLSIQNFRI